MHAIAERRRARLPELPVRIHLAPNHYLSGESSAILHALDGGPALPRFRPEPEDPCRSKTRPTLVHNVETLARIGLLARTGASDYEHTMLVTVATAHTRVVAEVEAGISVGSVVREVVREPTGAVLAGGFGGSWYGREQQIELPIGPDIGAGILLPLPANACGLKVSANILAYLAASGAGQCGPCLFGLPAVAHSFDQLAGLGSPKRVAGKVRRFLAEIEGRGACHHPDGAVRMAASALNVFADDLAQHGRGRCGHRGSIGFFPVPALDGPTR